ncbi:Hsp20/alpha crystallin family protein [Noviherbaspirillum galbum]|uniref:Hsp20/alpha crystallin family protein n=1 Tax=Noviherbaspirillum galbum TaxID=2709383 RepID=A0A6B3SR78_9BURK|nr:Hsp20/alpha crystallin family protein [Noviherbaspirillum galbum]NEX61835.1 Hsp20/alpha crystallin family protein [Noviherbaspirillum galbum]
MNLVVRRPYPQLFAFRRPAPAFDARFERLMENVLNDLFSPASRPASAQTVSPRINVVETDKAFELQAELPGVKKEDVAINVQDRRLTIEAEVKRTEEKKEGENLVYAERASRKFARSFALPAEVDESAAEARLENGVLTLTLPKKAPVQAKQIAIQ